MERPALIVLTGDVYAGKTTLGRELAKITRFPLFSHDQISNERGLTEKDYRLNPDLDSVVLEELSRRIRSALARRQGAIDDAVYPTRALRSARLAIADDFNVPAKLVYVVAPSQVKLERWRADDGSRGGKRLSARRFREASAQYELPGPDEEHIVYQSGDDVPSWIREHGVLLG